MIFSIATVGLAKIILKIFIKQNYKYSNLSMFCMIGLILSIILKILNFNLTYRPLEMIICFIINVIAFIIFKYMKKVQKSKNIQ